jgi:hypothetical protein
MMVLPCHLILRFRQVPLYFIDLFQTLLLVCGRFIIPHFLQDILFKHLQIRVMPLQKRLFRFVLAVFLEAFLAKGYTGCPAIHRTHHGLHRCLLPAGTQVLERYSGFLKIACHGQKRLPAYI